VSLKAPRKARPVKLHEVKNQQRVQAAREAKADIHKCAAIAADMPGGLSGFALVAWSREGYQYATMTLEEGGPVFQAMVPAMAADALSRWVTVSALKEGRYRDA
jgi:hypothetical protein